MNPEPRWGCDGPLGPTRWWPAPALPRPRTGTYGVYPNKLATSAFWGDIRKLELDWTLGILQAGARSLHHVLSPPRLRPPVTMDSFLGLAENPRGLAGALDVMIHGSTGGRAGAAPCEGGKDAGRLPPSWPPLPAPLPFRL